MIHFACPSCGKNITVVVEAAGKRGKCPACTTSFTVPAFDATSNSGGFSTGSTTPITPKTPPSPSSPPLAPGDTTRNTDSHGEEQPQFDTPTGQFLLSPSRRMKLGSLGVVLIIAGLGLIVLSIVMSDKIIFLNGILMGLFVLGLGAFLLLNTLRFRQLCATTFTDGIALMQDDEEFRCGWHEIAEIIEIKITANTEGNLYPVLQSAVWGHNHVFQLTCTDGRGVAFTNLLENLPKLGAIIQEATLPYLLPPAVAVLDRGGCVSFGKLSVDQQQISMGPDKTLPWNELLHAKIEYGGLTLTQVGQKKRVWFSPQLKTIPNVHVLLELIKKYRGEESVIAPVK